MTQVGWGRLLVARGKPEDLERAYTLFGQAFNSARNRGYADVERRALQGLESLVGTDSILVTEH
jgi:hypothetical protein